MNTNPKVTNLCILLNVCFWNVTLGGIICFHIWEVLFFVSLIVLLPLPCFFFCFCMFLLLFAFTTFWSFLFFCFFVFRVFLLSLLFAVYFSFFCCFFYRCHKRHLKNNSQIKENNLVPFFLRGLPFDIFASLLLSLLLVLSLPLSLLPSRSLTFVICPSVFTH